MARPPGAPSPTTTPPPHPPVLSPAGICVRPGSRRQGAGAGTLSAESRSAGRREEGGPAGVAAGVGEADLELGCCPGRSGGRWGPGCCVYPGRAHWMTELTVRELQPPSHPLPSCGDGHHHCCCCRRRRRSTHQDGADVAVAAVGGAAAAVLGGGPLGVTRAAPLALGHHGGVLQRAHCSGVGVARGWGGVAGGRWSSPACPLQQGWGG